MALFTEFSTTELVVMFAMGATIIGYALVQLYRLAEFHTRDKSTTLSMFPWCDPFVGGPILLIILSPFLWIIHRREKWAMKRNEQKSPDTGEADVH